LSQQSLFVAEADGLEPTEWAIGPWSPDTLQASAYGGLLVRALERSDPAPGMLLSRLAFDLWRPVTRQHLTPGTSILRDGRKARTVEASLTQAGRPVARCTAVFLKADAASTPIPPIIAAPVLGPEDGRPLPDHVRAWSPFFSGVDTRVVEGDLLKPGPAAAWFNLGRPLVLGEETSPFAHAVAAADLASGISAVVDLRAWTFVNADLTVLFWRVPRAPWILLRAETMVGDRGTGVARGTLSDLDGPFGGCEQTLLFERRQPTT
jgi:acyl-coenzyme A thioesterase PaaI-like protein